MNEKQLAEIEALCAAATPGPWRVGDSPFHGHAVSGNYTLLEVHSPRWQADVAFVAAARTAVPELADEVRRLRDALAFYADPDNYVGVLVMGDRPCGAFVDDTGETSIGVWHGRLAREALGWTDA